MSAHVLQTAGKVLSAKLLKAQAIYIAIGRGDPSWDALTPAQIKASTPTDATGLVDEIGRRLATVQYVKEDAAGPIEMVNADDNSRTKYSLSATPTAFLYVDTTFDYQEGSGESVRELAIFVGGEMATGLPPGQSWFTAAQVTVPGDVWSIVRMPAMYRDGVNQHAERTVLPM